jgi:histidinol-phosphate aminotransferase
LANINAVENKEVLLSEDFQPQIEKIMEVVTLIQNHLYVLQTTQPEIIFDESVAYL